MNNDDPTPQIQPVPQQLRDLDDGDPAVYLQQEPTAEERILTEQAGLHYGAGVPMWMFAKLAVRQRRQSRWIASIDGLLRRVKRRARVGLGTLAANLVLLCGYAVHRIEASAAADERLAAQERAFIEYRTSVGSQLMEMRLDIRELRATLHKLSGTDTNPDISVVSMASYLQPPPLALDRVVPLSSCANACSVSRDCQDILQSCRYCSSGQCSQTLPAEPTDAGVSDTAPSPDPKGPPP